MKARRRAAENGAKEIRTPDPLLAKQVLYQLSYGPEFDSADSGWWAWEDLNFRPPPYQSDALTN
jgi:hypothetical protein